MLTVRNPNQQKIFSFLRVLRKAPECSFHVWTDMRNLLSSEGVATARGCDTLADSVFSFECGGELSLSLIAKMEVWKEWLPKKE